MMINPLEVRFGNFFKFKNGGDYPRIIKVNSFNYTSLVDFPQDYANIEMTEHDLLFQPFFIKAGNQWANIENSLEVEDDEDGFNLYFKGIFIRKINFVHQLQNVVYELTGETLQMLND